jgi:hypothetical protein
MYSKVIVGDLPIQGGKNSIFVGHTKIGIRVFPSLCHIRFFA